MNMRKLTESDYETLSNWWKAWEWPPVEKDFLPVTLTFALISLPPGLPLSNPLP